MLTALTTLAGEPPGLLSSGRYLFISDMFLALWAQKVKREILLLPCEVRQQVPFEHALARPKT
jgi:hypothetical protein